MISYEEKVRDYFDSKMDDINLLIEKYGREDEHIPESLLAFVIHDNNIQLLKDYLIFGHATHPYNKRMGWTRLLPHIEIDYEDLKERVFIFEQDQ